MSTEKNNSEKNLGEKNIRTAIAAFLCQHPDAEKFATRAFGGESLQKLADVMQSGDFKLAKADFFAPDEQGGYICDTRGFWANFDKIHAVIRNNGEQLTAEDFSLNVREGARRTMVQSALQFGALQKLFSQDIWEGRYDDMESLWFRVPVTPRRDAFKGDGTIGLELKRNMLAAEGREPAEDMLARAGLTANDLHNAFKEKGTFDALTRKLAQSGDFLRKEYLLLPNYLGDTLFANKEIWSHYSTINANLTRNGQQLDVADFTRQVGFVNNILARASEEGALDKIFAPAAWEGRLDDMLTLWSSVKEGWKRPPMTNRDFDAAYAVAEDRTYAPLADFSELTTRASLLTPLNDGVIGANDNGNAAVLPLGLKSFWDKAEALRNNLEDSLRVEDLRLTSGRAGHSCMMTAAKQGQFKSVVNIVRGAKGELTQEDFLSKDRHGNTLLNVLAERGELSLAFTPDLWAGRVTEMKALWSHVRHAHTGQVNIEKVEIAVKQATLKHQVKDKFKIKPR